jgi:hypothetical protein
VRRSTIAALALLTVIGATSAYRLTRTTKPTLPTTAPPPTTQSTSPPVEGNRTAASVTTSTVPAASTTSRPMTDETPTHAALRFLDLDEELFPPVTPDKARALTESIASLGSRERLGDQAADHQRQTLAKGDLAGLTLRIAPIVTRTRNCTDTVCTVDVYFLRLWSFPGRGALDDYATVEIHVVRENDEWRLDSSSLIDGPYPAGRFSARPNASFNAPSFETTLSGFTDSEMNQ